MKTDKYVEYGMKPGSYAHTNNDDEDDGSKKLYENIHMKNGKENGQCEIHIAQQKMRMKQNAAVGVNFRVIKLPIASFPN